jgi:catechol 2,3-dioxygenase-like lactoylglutathione lyase family enzyme
MFTPFPMMFHPTLVVDDLEASAAWFRRVFGRTEVRWGEKWDITLLNPDYPIDYSYFFVLGDVCLDVLAPSLLVLPGDREAVYPSGEGLADIAWYTDRIEDVAVLLEKNGFRTRDQEGAIVRGGRVPESGLVADCPMIWTLPQDTGLTYEFYQMARRHWPRYARRADPRLDPAWRPGVVAGDDPLHIVRAAAHTVLTEDPDRALRLFALLGGEPGRRGYDEHLDADTVEVRYAGSPLRFATPRRAPLTDLLTGEPTHADQYLGITFEVADIDAVAAHLDAQEVPCARAGHAIVTDRAATKGAQWSFVPARP